MNVQCSGVFRKVVQGTEVAFVINLFKMMGIAPPKGKMLGCIDATRVQCPSDCPFRYSGGFGYYCNNQRYIKRYLKKHKNDGEVLRIRNMS